MCCQRKGYSRAAAACNAAESVSRSWATINMRLSRSMACSKAMSAPDGRCHSSRAKGMPAFQLPLPVSGGICSSMNVSVLQQRQNLDFELAY